MYTVINEKNLGVERLRDKVGAESG